MEVRPGDYSRANSSTYTTSADMTSAADLTTAPSSGKSISVLDVIISTDTAMLFSLVEETSGTVLAAVRLPVNGTVTISPRSWLTVPTAGKKLQGLAGAAGNVYITVNYNEV